MSNDKVISEHSLMGESTADKTENMIQNINAEYIAPVEIIAHKS